MQTVISNVHFIHNATTKVLLALCLCLNQGMALVFAPLRGETLRLFSQLAQQAGLCVTQQQQYDAQVWDVHLKVGRISWNGTAAGHTARLIACAVFIKVFKESLLEILTGS